MALEAAANTLRAEKLVKSFSGRRVVNEVSVKIEKGASSPIPETYGSAGRSSPLCRCTSARARE